MKKNKEKQPAFSEQVYQMVSRVPKGKVATYGQIALWINPAGGAGAFALQNGGGALPSHCKPQRPYGAGIYRAGAAAARRGRCVFSKGTGEFA